MCPVKWNKIRHGVGVPKMDQQHQYLYKLTHDIEYELKTCSRPIFEVIPHIDRLNWYVKEHFTVEEFLFRYFKYDDPSHLKEHTHFLDSFHKYNHKIFERCFDVDELLNFLFEWFDHHLITYDKQYVHFMDYHIN